MSWQNRIVDHGAAHPGELIAHDKNWRTHPVAQKVALAAAIDEVGYLRSVTVNRRTGRILDGHLRVKLALEKGESAIPVEYVDLSENEEVKALLTLDPLAAMAEADKVALDGLLREVQTGSPDLQEMLAGLAKNAGLYLDRAAAESEGDTGEDPADAGGETTESPGAPSQVIQYAIIFDGAKQLDRWYRLLKRLREDYPDLETIGARIDRFLEHGGF